jgi:hypothetical protein
MARCKLGQKIGRGECWDLGEQALKQAGAHTSNDLGPIGDDTDYIWGEPISDVKDIEIGDLLQLRDHVVITTTETKYTFQFSGRIGVGRDYRGNCQKGPPHSYCERD